MFIANIFLLQVIRISLVFVNKHCTVDPELYNTNLPFLCIFCSPAQDIERKARLLRRERELKKNILLPQYKPRWNNFCNWHFIVDEQR